LKEQEKGAFRPSSACTLYSQFLLKTIKFIHNVTRYCIKYTKSEIWDFDS